MIMQLEGYVARIEYDEDEKTFRGKVANIRDSIVFVGKTPEELETEEKIELPRNETKN